MKGKEYLIGDYFRKNFEMEQIRGNMYFPNNIYHNIPALVFRFSKSYGDEIYNELKICVETFKGKLAWTIFPGFACKRIINYLMVPEAEFERERNNFENQKLIPVKEYYSEEAYKNLCDSAIEDIEGLYAHLTNNFYKHD